MLPDATETARADVLGCSMTTMGMLGADERQVMVDTQLRLNEAQKAQIGAAHPGFFVAMDACLELAGGTTNTASSSSSSTATVTLPDGRSLTLVSDGGAQSVTAVDGGYNLIVGNTRISFVNGKLTVNGDMRTVPAFTKSLTITVRGGSVTLAGA
jgi:phage baseplate assembly protein gpV